MIKPKYFPKWSEDLIFSCEERACHWVESTLREKIILALEKLICCPDTCLRWLKMLIIVVAFEVVAWEKKTRSSAKSKWEREETVRLNLTGCQVLV